MSTLSFRRRVAMIAAIACLVSVASTASTSAAPGDLDPSFGKGGIVRAASFSDLDAVAIDGQGRVVAAGVRADGSGVGLARYTADGTLDASFGEGGTAEVITAAGASVSDVLVEPTGRILVASAVDGQATLNAFNEDGSIAASFGSGGQATDLRVSGTLHLATGTAGRLFVLGASGGPAVQRLLSTGENDPSYGVDGVAIARGIVRGGALAVGPNDSVIVGVSVISRLTPTGNVDSSFGTDGAVAIDVDAVKTESLTLAPGGQILVGALECDDPSQSDEDCLESLVRIEPSGTSNRQLAVGAGTLVNTLADGSLTLAGSYPGPGGLPSTIALTHRTLDGTLLTPFGIEGHGAALQGFRGLDIVDAATGGDTEAVIGVGKHGPVVARFLLGPSSTADADADGVANSRDKCDLGFGLAPSGCRKAQRSLHVLPDSKGVIIEVKSQASSCASEVRVSLFADRAQGRRLVERQSTGADPFAFFRLGEVGRYFAAVKSGNSELARCRAARSRPIVVN